MIDYVSIIEKLNGRIPAIIGPTAVGKTAFTLALALQYNAEIISIDSRQIYRGFKIGTAQPGPDESGKVPHHLVNLLPADRIISAGDYRSLVLTKIREIRDRGKNPVLSGGTFLYISAICNGIVENDDSLLAIRKKIQDCIHKEGPEKLHAELQELDPEYCSVVHVNDLKRLQRAFEIYYQTGLIPTRAFEQQKLLDKTDREHYYIISLERDREQLYTRIDERVDLMINTGWLQEVEELRNSGVKREFHAMQSVGYKQLFQVLEGEFSLEDAVEIIKQKTRQFAKRQLTWLRKMEMDLTIPLS